MAYDSKAMKIALENFQKDKDARTREYLEKKEIIYHRMPKLADIEAEIKTAYPKILAAALRNREDPNLAIESIKKENLELQAERARLLMQLGYPEDALEEKPDCKKCGDTGVYKDGICECLLQYYQSAQNQLLSKMLDFQGQSFDLFDLSLYSAAENKNLGKSPLENMKRNYTVCRDYAYNFGDESDNLLFSGGAGTGKTFLSTCIAKVVSQKGKSVVYDTAVSIFNVFEKEKFNKDEEEDSDITTKRYLNCDLLIMDDLGTELKTSFIDTALYTIINDRLINRKKTIISTNLAVKEIEERYNIQIASRLRGEYTVLPFFGEDLRIKKAKQNKNSAEEK